MKFLVLGISTTYTSILENDVIARIVFDHGQYIFYTQSIYNFEQLRYGVAGKVEDIVN